MKKTTKKSQDLKHTICDVMNKDCADMTDQEIRKNFLNSKDWEKQVNDLTTSKETIDLDSVGVIVDTEIKDAFETELHDAINKFCT